MEWLKDYYLHKKNTIEKLKRHGIKEMNEHFSFSPFPYFYVCTWLCVYICGYVCTYVCIFMCVHIASVSILKK